MSTPSLVCRLLPFCRESGAWQMAADEVMLERAGEGVASLRFYAWSEPTLSLGYFQEATRVRLFPRLGELAFVRRATGGDALVHHLEITYSFAVPTVVPWVRKDAPWIPRMHRVIQRALSAMGVDTELCTEEMRLSDVLCFQHQTPGDLILRGEKITGSAQRKRAGALLQHGSILLDTSPRTPMLPGVMPLSGVAIPAEDLIETILTFWGEEGPWVVERSDWSNEDRARIDEVKVSRYLAPAWTLRR